MRTPAYIAVLPFFISPLPAQTNVLTANYGNSRLNANLSETLLTPTSVSVDTFGKLGAFPVDGQIYTQPLYVSGLKLAAGPKNVVFAATQHNSLYAIDADAPSSTKPLWRVNLGPAVASSTLKLHDIVPEVGILGTPVIDLARSVIYVVAETVDNGAPAFQLHALNLADGAEAMHGPVRIAASVPGSGDDSAQGVLRFDASQHLQRPGLLLAGGAIYAAFGSHSDQAPWHGWMMAYDGSDLRRQTAALCTTPDGWGGSLWHSGRAPAEEAGTIFVGTANGAYDGNTSFGNGFLKLSANLKLLDWFTPDNWRFLTDGDYDMGSAGPALIPGTGLVIGGNKFGTLYLIDRQNMGRLAADNSAGVQSFAAVESGGIFNFAVWPADSGLLVYIQDEGSTLKAYRMVNGRLNTSSAAEGPAVSDYAYVGIAVSAHGGQDGIVWMTEGDHTTASVPGALHAFDALTLEELWNSRMNPKRDPLGRFAKFVAPTVANGKVYVPTFSGELAIYGLQSGVTGNNAPQISFVASLASYEADAVSPGEVVTISGIQIGPDAGMDGQPDASGVLPGQVADTQVLFDGVPAPLLYVSSAEIRTVVPFAVSAPVTQIQVVYQGTPSDPFSVGVQAATPGLFSADGTGSGQAQASNEDGTANSPDNPASAGSIITLHGTGFGQTNPPGIDGAITAVPLGTPQQPVTITIDGQAAQLLYVGAMPGAVTGLMQITAVIPAGVVTGPMVSVVVTVADQASADGVFISVQ